ncbi:MAG: 16S rRNA (guanine(527)-N(7))-methyltransferase RsmG [Desulfobacteraceae bacterium]|nr:16S rRNA (guanine(527)-N(7))-methyltransferase RsmG [Desulfobacteraceae bacterium]
MARILGSAGIVLSPAQIGQLWNYHQMLRRHNQELNLTRIHNFQNMVQKLYIDSILPGMIIELPSPLMDLGTGAGMPGIPLKIAFPDLEIVLVESRKNRVEFLQAVLDQIGLKGVRNLGHGIAAASEVPVNAVITRAVEAIPQTLERISGSLAKGGLAVFMKGPHCEEELEQALDRFAGRYRLVENHSYKIPHSPHDRTLVVFERIDSPPWVRKAVLAGEDLVRIIESENNETFRNLRKLLAPRGIRKQQQALVSGRKQVIEVMTRFPEKCVAWVGRGEKEPPPETAPNHMQWYQLAPSLFEVLDLFGTAAPLLLVRVEPIPAWEPSDGLPEGCTLFVPFQDPENVGAVIRSAVAFGVAGIVLLAEAANPFHPKAVRASGGMVFGAKLLAGPSINDLPDSLPLVPLSKEGRDIRDWTFPSRFGLLPGIEGPGLPAVFRDRGISVPIDPGVESLNAVVATAIALFAWSGSLKDGGTPA